MLFFIILGSLGGIFLRIGIAGLGIVGGSVYKILTEKYNELFKREGISFYVSKVITRTKSKYDTFNIPEEKIADDFEDLIINSDIVVEAIGGCGAALELVRHALELDRIVVTPNKQLISEHGTELVQMTLKKNLFFEGSVGGGIPIVSTLEDYLVFHGIKKIRGIINGTTNYILTSMGNGISYKEALKEAQELGFAESDPTNDVEGYDVAYKLSVLHGTIDGDFIGLDKVKRVGINNVEQNSIKKAKEKECKIKLIGSIDFENDKTEIKLEEIDKLDPLWSVDGVENAIEVQTDVAGKFVLRGEGAGGNPTATAVISDIVRASRAADIERKSFVVMKFGGSSLSSIEKIKKIADKINNKIKIGIKPVVVVSAMGNTTNELLSLSKEVNNNPSPREIDMLLSCGEQKTIALMSMALQNLGLKSMAFSGAQAKIYTDGNYNDAKIVEIDTNRINNYMKEGIIPVIAGFQGISNSGELTTLGRGGSDLTAIALTYSLGLEVCELYKDVNGVYTADPTIVKEAKIIKELSYEEMIELSKQGAQVLQSRAAEFARKYRIKVLIKDAHNEKRGTLIWEGSKMEKPIVRAVTSDESIIKVVLYNVPDKPGVAARVMRNLAEQKISIDMIIQSMREQNVNSMSFIMQKKEFDRLNIDDLKDKSEAEKIIVEDSFAKVSIVGINLTSSPIIAAELFETLANDGINIDMINAGISRISVVIDGKKVQDAVISIHSRFNLGKE